MSNIVTVYSTPNCQQCKATYRKLDKLGVAYQVVDLSKDEQAREHLIGEGFAQAPIVKVRKVWSGYRPEMLDELGEW